MKSVKVSSKERWDLAQNAEKGFWGGLSEEFVEKHSRSFIKKADFLTELLSKYKKINSKTKFLQIGCACYDIINYLKIGQKYSIDPLADFYKSRFRFDYKKTNLVSGIGENLPYPDNTFDVVILANVLDHTQDPQKVLLEANRVMKKDGILFFENHFYQNGFLILSSLYSFLKSFFSKGPFNICHPHMFSLKELKHILTQRFNIFFEDEIGRDIERGITNLKELRKFLMKEKLSRRIPAFFGLLGTIIFTCLCRKKN